MWTFSGLLIHCNHGLHLYHHTVVLPIIYYRSTPVECLHTLLLGPFKYMTEQLMTRLTASQKREVKAKLRGFDFSPFSMFSITRCMQSLPVISWTRLQDPSSGGPVHFLGSSSSNRETSVAQSLQGIQIGIITLYGRLICF